MRDCVLSRYARVACIAVAMLGGCSGSRPASGAYVGPSSASAIVGKDQNLLYVSDPKAGDVYMIALPSGRLVGKLTGFLQWATASTSMETSSSTTTGRARFAPTRMAP